MTMRRGTPPRPEPCSSSCGRSRRGRVVAGGRSATPADVLANRRLLELLARGAPRRRGAVGGGRRRPPPPRRRPRLDRRPARRHARVRRAGRTDWAVHVALVERGASSSPARSRCPRSDVVLDTRRRRRRRPRRRAAAPASSSAARRPPAAAHRRRRRARRASSCRMGSAGAKAMAVVRGEADVYVHAGGQYEWDSAAPGRRRRRRRAPRLAARRVAARVQPARPVAARPRRLPGRAREHRARAIDCELRGRRRRRRAAVRPPVGALVRHGPPVVLVHGFRRRPGPEGVRGSPRRSPRDGLDVVAVRRAGHGGSGGAATLGDLERHDVAAAVDAARGRSTGRARRRLDGRDRRAALRGVLDTTSVVGRRGRELSRARWRLPRNAPRRARRGAHADASRALGRAALHGRAHGRPGARTRAAGRARARRSAPVAIVHGAPTGSSRRRRGAAPRRGTAIRGGSTSSPAMGHAFEPESSARSPPRSPGRSRTPDRADLGPRAGSSHHQARPTRPGPVCTTITGPNSPTNAVGVDVGLLTRSSRVLGRSGASACSAATCRRPRRRQACIGAARAHHAVERGLAASAGRRRWTVPPRNSNSGLMPRRRPAQPGDPGHASAAHEVIEVSAPSRRAAPAR